MFDGQSSLGHVSGWCLLVLLGGCATYQQPVPLEEISFWDRAQTQSSGPVVVTAAVLSPLESQQAFGVNMAKQGIQPLYLKIENNDDVDYGFYPILIDADYFSPNEAAWKCHVSSGAANSEIDEHFFMQGIPLYVEPGGTIEGFVYTNLIGGVRIASVQLISTTKRTRRFDFILAVPGLRADFEDVDFATLYEDDEVFTVDIDGLRNALEALPCCAMGPDGETPADPLNLVVVGDAHRVVASMTLQGWNVTEKITAASSLHMAWSSVFKTEYKTSPVSSLYLFDRQQDLALQKSRKTVDERNHLRLWLAPFRFNGAPVWVGQISRDIGVRLTTKTIVTHKIDPNIDEAREYLLQDLVVSQALAGIGYVYGVGAARRAEPRGNYTGDPYFTDGYRVVFFLADEPTALGDIELLWELPTLDWK